MNNETLYDIPVQLLNIICLSIDEIKSIEESYILVQNDIIRKNIKNNLKFHLNDEGDSIIHLLADNDKINVLKEIINFFKTNNLDFGEIINIKNNSNYTPLHLAASKGHLSTVEFLCEHNANVNALTENNFTPLHCAGESGNISVFECLINHGANLNAITKYGSSILHYAAGATGDSHFELSKLLIEKYGAIKYVNYLDEEKYTPLHESTHSGNFELSKYLIEECGADINLLTIHGNSILHMAAVSGNLNLVKYLVEKHKMNVNAIDNKGNSILDYAIIGKNKDVQKYLIEEHGLKIDKSVTSKLD